MNGIRLATIDDLESIQTLLAQLDYPDTQTFLSPKLPTILKHPDAITLVYEMNDVVVAFLSLHFIPQIALEGDFARISYFVVDKSARGQFIGQELEAYGEMEARKRHCNRIEVHCHTRRKDAHRFYERQGYVESPKYFIKLLNT
ncbi:MAG: GNAT family N-acetyltransferase [Sulfurospirillaceae bacterium]|nr:GNAT family N-acetyltransferase [Sulfurospirillaceae bacterium]MDD2827050.1 GNAT family N-acetyltransferase [Sulfurospirillaceae bacterium]